MSTSGMIVVILRLIIFGAVAVAAWATWTAWFRPRPLLEILGDVHRRGNRTIAPMGPIGWAVIAGTLIGFGAVFFSGFSTMLAFIPSSWGTVNEEGEWVLYRDTISTVLASIGALSLTGLLSKVSWLRFKEPYWKAIEQSVEKLLFNGQSSNTPNPKEIEDLRGKAASSAVTDDERDVAHHLAWLLQGWVERDKLLHQRWHADQKAKADRAALEHASRREEQERIRRREEDLQRRVAVFSIPLPSISDLEASTESESLISDTITESTWDAFDALVHSIERFNSPDLELRGQRLLTALENEGHVSLPAGFRTTVRENEARQFELMAISGETATPLIEAIQFEERIASFLMAFFLATALSRSWPLWRGLDHELIMTTDQLRDALATAWSPAFAREPELRPPPGVRLRRLDSGIELSCLAASPTSLSGLHLPIVCGRVGKLRSEIITHRGPRIYMS